MIRHKAVGFCVLSGCGSVPGSLLLSSRFWRSRDGLSCTTSQGTPRPEFQKHMCNMFSCVLCHVVGNNLGTVSLISHLSLCLCQVCTMKLTVSVSCLGVGLHMGPCVGVGLCSVCSVLSVSMSVWFACVCLFVFICLCPVSVFIYPSMAAVCLSMSQKIQFRVPLWPKCFQGEHRSISLSLTFRLTERQPLNYEEYQTPSLVVFVVLCFVSDDIYILSVTLFEHHNLF